MAMGAYKWRGKYLVHTNDPRDAIVLGIWLVLVWAILMWQTPLHAMFAVVGQALIAGPLWSLRGRRPYRVFRIAWVYGMSLYPMAFAGLLDALDVRGPDPAITTLLPFVLSLCTLMAFGGLFVLFVPRESDPRDPHSGALIDRLDDVDEWGQE